MPWSILSLTSTSLLLSRTDGNFPFSNRRPVLSQADMPYNFLRRESDPKSSIGRRRSTRQGRPHSPTRVSTAGRTQQIADPTHHCPTPTPRSLPAEIIISGVLRPIRPSVCYLLPPRLALASLSLRRPHAAARDTGQRPGVRRRRWRLWGRGVLR
jgi:hypothetical protein